MTSEFAVVGAGVVGLAVATELTRRGARVRIFDRESSPGPHACSWWAGGMLAPYCEAETAEAPVLRLGLEAVDWWERAGAAVTRAGSLVVALRRDRGELDRFARRTQRHRWIDRATLSTLEPALAERFDRALYFPDEAHLDPRSALFTLRDGLVCRGVALETEEPRTRNISIIDCRGLASSDALADLRGVRGEMAVLRAPDVQLARPVRLLHPRHRLYIVPRGGGDYMVGATQIEGAHRGPVTVRSVLELLSAAYALDPAYGEAELLETGADARPAFPDNLPRIRRRDGRIYVNGLFRHGFLLAPALARMTAELLLKNIKPEVMDEDHGER